MNVLIIEDSIHLSEEIDQFLKQRGFLCDIAYTKRKALDKLVSSYDIVLLDLHLPDGEGLDILSFIRSQEEREDGVLVLTARNIKEDVVKSLNLGADDYLIKPFDLAELNARIHAILRRKHHLVRNDIHLHGFIIEIQNRAVRFKEHLIKLTKKEFDILLYLAINKNHLISRTVLTEHIWNDILEINIDSNFVDVHVKNLRKKLQAFASINWFETVRSIGYRIKD